MAHEELNGFRRDLQEPLLQGCSHCGAGNDAHHSYSCPTGKHPDRAGEFQPECFSGLNWREALEKGLVGEKVEFSQGGENWRGPERLTGIDKRDVSCHYFFKHRRYVYIRTTPETFKHPTVTIAGGWKLARPETKALDKGKEYWLWTPTGGVQKTTWWGTIADKEWLKMAIIHLKESRAQEWADWWNKTVVKAVNK